MSECAACCLLRQTNEEHGTYPEDSERCLCSECADRFRVRIAALASCVGYYANESNWRRTTFHGSGARWRKGVADDRGERARATLRSLEEGDNG